MILTKDEISFFDLDGTLWNIKEDVFIIDKERPYKKLLTIPRYEYMLIKNGFYQKDGVKLDYNGEIYYIHKKMFDKVKKRANSQNSERFGISFINYDYKDYIKNSEMKFLLNNIIHLTNDITDIGILTARYNQRNHGDLLNILRIELKKLNLELNKIFFISDKLYSKTPYFQSMSKMFVLLEHLVGLKIVNGKFTNEKQDTYNIVNFYDDNIRNIDVTNNIMFYFSNMLYKVDDTLYNYIINRIKNNRLILNTYLISNNTLNPFKKNSIILTIPTKYPIYKDVTIVENIKKYDQFLKKQ